MSTLRKSSLPPRRSAPPVKKPEGFEPEYVAWEPRFAAHFDGIFLAIFGIEERGPDVGSIRGRLVDTFGLPGGPEILETGTTRAGFGQPGQIWFAYWRTRESYKAWFDQPSVSEFWADDDLLSGDIGLWREECWISLDHNETSYSRDADLTGLGHLSDGLAETHVHGYWGSARDRIVAAAEADLPGIAKAFGDQRSGLGQRISVAGPANACLIRTSQDLNLASADQLRVYHEQVEPTLFAGLQFLRSGGRQEGCMGMRLIDEIDVERRDLGRTCGIGFFNSLADLEHWTHEHPTHGAIMESFIGMVQRFEGQPGLHLWHEITVFPAGALRAEYINCSDDGGLLSLSA
jgi:Haem-containing dehydratase